METSFDIGNEYQNLSENNKFFTFASFKNSIPTYD